MPDEMKGDRSYHEILRRLGVKNIGELHVQNPIVMTAQVDNLSDIHAPLANNLYHGVAAIGDNPGQRSGAYLVSAGCWLDIFWAANPYQYWTDDATPPALLNLAEVVPRVLGGEASLANQRTRLYVARDVLGNWPAPATWKPISYLTNTYENKWMRIYLPPGRTFYSVEMTDGNDIRHYFWWTEMPPAPPGG